MFQWPIIGVGVDHAAVEEQVVVARLPALVEGGGLLKVDLGIESEVDQDVAQHLGRALSNLLRRDHHRLRADDAQPPRPALAPPPC